MTRCNICQEPIWESRWPDSAGDVRKFVCLHCIELLKSRKEPEYKSLSEREAFLEVCDCCGEVSSDVERTESERICADCSE